MKKHESLQEISGGDSKPGVLEHIESGSLDSIFLLNERRMIHWFNKNPENFSDPSGMSEEACQNKINNGIQENGVFFIALFAGQDDTPRYSYLLGKIALA